MNSPVNALFARIARVYDFLNHFLSLGIDRSWRRELARLTKGATILDLAAGTLDVALALHKASPASSILAMDFSMPMLKYGAAKLNTDSLNQAITVIAADGRELPLPDNSIDAITIAFGIRNIKPRESAYKEMLRVLKPGGKIGILEFGSASERIWGGIYNFYLAVALPLIGRMVAGDKTAYDYLARTVKEFPTAPELAAELKLAGYSNVGYRKLTGGIVCLHWGEKL